jgi:hypothetical protein
LASNVSVKAPGGEDSSIDYALCSDVVALKLMSLLATFKDYVFKEEEPEKAKRTRLSRKMQRELQQAGKHILHTRSIVALYDTLCTTMARF